MKKALLGLLAVVVLVVAVGLAVVYVRLGWLVKHGMEKYGSKMLGAPVSVGLVSVSPFSGRARLSHLSVGNPAGYPEGNAIEVGGVKVAFELKSFFGSGDMLIDDIEIGSPQLTVITGKGGTNLQQLQRNLEAYSPSSPQEQQKTQGRKVVIKRLKISGAKAAAEVPQLGVKRQVAIPDVELTGIGEKSGGATAAQAAKEVLDAVVSRAVQSAGGVQGLLDQVKGLFKR